MSAVDKKFIQEVTGTFLYYTRALDSIMLPALRTIAPQQSNPTENTTKKVKCFLDYTATRPDAIITYCACNMVLVAHSNISYLSESKVRSCAWRYIFCIKQQRHPSKNVTVITVSQITKVMMSSATEVELGALFINCREAIPARHELKIKGHKQSPIPVHTNNTTTQ